MCMFDSLECDKDGLQDFESFQVECVSGLVLSFDEGS